MTPPLGTLSRRDRAAMVLAYEALRLGHLGAAMDILGHGDEEAYRLRVVARSEFDWVCFDRRERSYRLLRARLALLLRVLLRADAGDYGEVTCERCGNRGDGTHETGEPCGLCWQTCVEPVPSYRPRHFAPLWESAT